jgi:vesicle-fusing ATPase
VNTDTGGAATHENPFADGLDLKKMGIGGLDKEFDELRRRAFNTRLLPASWMRKLGHKHVRGILLYGPPGCGKTLIARKLAEALKAREPKIIQGPEVLNRYVGASEEAIRDLFKDAEKEQEEAGENSGLHVIIMDEIDAICKARGSSGDSTGVSDNIVNQLLAKIDGVNSLNNVLLIGMTNRKDMLDEALLRPGRMEVHIEIGLPREEGRRQILDIHTRSLRELGSLADDVDIGVLATLTKNFTGAEIEGLCKMAVAFAIDGFIDPTGMRRREDMDLNDVHVTMAHFEASLEIIKPRFGSQEQSLREHFRQGMNRWPAYDALQSSLDTIQRQVSDPHSATQMLSVLLEGPPGCGKTALAAFTACESNFPFVKMVTAADLIARPSAAGKINLIQTVFEDAYKTPLAIVVLDDLENIIEYVRMGNSYNPSILNALRVLCNQQPPVDGRRLLVLATTSEPGCMRDLGLHFQRIVSIPCIERKDDFTTLLRAFTDDGITQEVADAIGSQICESLTGGVPVKKLLNATALARAEAAGEASAISVSKFMGCFLESVKAVQ